MSTTRSKQKNVFLVENLKPNLLSVSQTCNQGYNCIFDSKKCEIKNKKLGKIVGISMRNANNVYILENENQSYLSMIDESWLWHRRLGHLSLENLAKISAKEAVRDLPKIVAPLNAVCKHCQHGKQTKASFKTKEHMTSHPLEIVHTDLCGPTRTKIMQGYHYFMLLIDDYTRMTWVAFLKEKSEAFEKFKIFNAMVQNESGMKIKCLR